MSKPFIPDIVAVCVPDTLLWLDPWQDTHSEEVYRVQTSYRLADYVQQTQHVDNGYDGYDALVVHLPMPHGTIIRYVNTMDYAGGAWWRQLVNGKAVLSMDRPFHFHDRDTLKRDRKRLIDYRRNPIQIERVFPNPS